MNFRSFVALAFLCLAACSQEVPQPAAPEPAAVASPAPAAAQPAPTDAGMSPAAAETTDSPQLAILFVEKPACASGEAASVTVKWDVVSMGASTVAVYVESPGNPRKLWIEAGASGEGTTGKWIYDKSRFTVQDRASGKVLATRLIEKPCTP